MRGQNEPIAWVGKVITVASSRIEELCTILKEGKNEEVNQQLNDVYGVIDASYHAS